MRKSLILIGGLALFLVLVIVGIWLSFTSSAEVLTEAEARELVLQQYPGEIVHTTYDDAMYVITINHAQGLYEMKLDAKNGVIHSLNQLESHPPASITPNPLPDETIDPNQPTNEPAEVDRDEPQPPSDDAVRRLTEQEAEAIASDHMQGGKIDDIEFRQTGTGSYYLVEIKFEDNDDDDREAIVQIHAISGSIMSVTWDD